MPWTKDGTCPACGGKLRVTTFGQACRACPYDRYGSETQRQALDRHEKRTSDPDPDHP